MAQGIRPEFEASFPEDWTGSDGKLLGREFEALEAAAERGGSTPLSAFMDYRPIPEEIVEDAEALEDFAEDWDEWFPSSAGAQAVEGLMAAPSVGLGADAESVRQQLRQLAECLRRAQAHGVRFRLVFE